MDSLTQIVLGAAVGEAVLGRKVGNKAILWGAIAGTIPDLDVLLNLFTDKLTANEMHRGFSHSILFCVIAAPLLGWLISKIYKKQEATWQDWSKLMFWGLFTHPILDAFTTWGTQLFWPLANKISFKNIFVVDPLYTLPFLICVIVAMCYKRTNPKRKKINLLGIYISSTYMLITLLLKWYTYGVFKNSLEDQNIAYAEIQTKPTPLNSILWNANVETENSYLIGSYSLFDKDKEVNFSEHKKNYHLLEGLENDPTIDRLKKLTQGWYTVQKLEGKLFVNDLRFGLMSVNDNSDEFVFKYEITNTENGALIATQTDPNPKDAGPMLKELWERILGKEPLKHIHDVGHISSKNNPLFKHYLPYKNIVGSYHSSAPKIYKNGKNSFREYILNNYKNNTYKDSGYLNFRFHIDFNGNVENLEVNELNENLEKTNLTDELVNQLISLIIKKENWDTFLKKEVYYYMYLNFKIENGEITEILP